MQDSSFGNQIEIQKTCSSVQNGGKMKLEAEWLDKLDSAVEISNSSSDLAGQEQREMQDSSFENQKDIQKTCSSAQNGGKMKIEAEWHDKLDSDVEISYTYNDLVSQKEKNFGEGPGKSVSSSSAENEEKMKLESDRLDELESTVQSSTSCIVSAGQEQIEELEFSGSQEEIHRTCSSAQNGGKMKLEAECHDEFDSDVETFSSSNDLAGHEEREMQDSSFVYQKDIQSSFSSAENREKTKLEAECNDKSGTIIQTSASSTSPDQEQIEKQDSSTGGLKEIENNVPAQKEKSSGPPLPSQPAGLGSSVPLLEPPARRPNGSFPRRQTQLVDDVGNGEGEEADETREKLQMIRVKFLRLAHRLGQTPHNVVVAQVLYRLGLAEQLRGSRQAHRAGSTFSFDRASAMAEQLEASDHEPLDFSCTIMVIGKSGVGKSSTINSIFDEVKLATNAFDPCTTNVQDIIGTVQGIKVRVIDTPGLSPSSFDHQKNEKILNSVKSFIRSSPPDIVLYLDRLDTQSRDYGDVSLLRTVTEIFGASIWFNAIIVLTHAGSAPPEGNNGTAMSYEMFVTQRSHVVQQAIRQAAGDMRLMNPVSLVENHSACRMNRAGQRVLPNGQVWKPQLLLLSFASKILAEANELLKLQDSPPGNSQARSPSLPGLLSSLLQLRPPPKLPEDDGDSDYDSSESEDELVEFESLPPFKILNKAQLARLSSSERAAYYEELDYREKLLYKTQRKEERKRRRRRKEEKMEEEEETGSPASVPVPMADLALPASFDSDAPSHRYRFLDSASPWAVSPVLETQGWDHEVGYEGLNVGRLFVLRDVIPVSVSGQLTKDKKEFNLQMEVAGSVKHGERKISSFGLDLQTLGKDLAYTVRGETRLSSSRRNTLAAGASATVLGDSVSGGVKIEDKLVLSKRLRMVVSGGAVTGRGDVACGGRVEAVLRDVDDGGRRMMTAMASVVDWHGDLALGCNLQTQMPVGRHGNLIAHGSLNNRGSGQVGIRLSSSEQLQIALVALIPILKGIQRMFGFGDSASY